MNTSQATLRLRQVIRRQHKALATEENYVFWLRRCMASVRQMPGTLSSEKKLEQFLTECMRPMCPVEHRDSPAVNDDDLPGGWGF